MPPYDYFDPIWNWCRDRWELKEHNSNHCGGRKCSTKLLPVSTQTTPLLVLMPNTMAMIPKCVLHVMMHGWRWWVNSVMLSVLMMPWRDGFGDVADECALTAYCKVREPFREISPASARVWRLAHHNHIITNTLIIHHHEQALHLSPSHHYISITILIVLWGSAVIWMYAVHCC